MPDSPFMKVREVIEITGWGRAVVYARINDGTLPHMRTATGRIYIPRQAFQKWLSQINERALAGVRQ